MTLRDLALISVETRVAESKPALRTGVVERNPASWTGVAKRSSLPSTGVAESRATGVAESRATGVAESHTNTREGIMERKVPVAETRVAERRLVGPSDSGAVQAVQEDITRSVEATTVTSDEATTVTSDEATTVTSDEATTVTSDEATTVTSDEATTVTSDEAATVTSDEATTEPQQRNGPDGGAMSEPYALLVLHSLPDSQVPPLVSQRGEASMGALQSAVQRGAAAQHNPRGRTVRAAIALGGITAREVGARARSLQGLVATELGLPHAAIALLSATPHAGGVHIEFTAVAYGAAAEGLVSAIEDLNGHKIAQALALARDTERLVSATLRFTRAFVGSRGSEFRSRVQGVLADALMTQSGYVVAPDVIIDQVEHWGQVVQFKVRVGQTFQEEVVKAIQGLAVGKLEQALAWR